MNQSFYTALTGSKAFQYAIDVTANDISNINNVGYKSSSTEFGNLFSAKLGINQQTVASDKGYGTSATAALNLQEGSYQTTDNTFDLAINGDGWFGVLNNNPINANDIGFTRNGIFSTDRDSYLVNTSGNYLLGTNYGNLVETENGYQIDPNVAYATPSTTAQTKLFVPSTVTYPPLASSKVEILSNLNDDKVYYSPVRKETTFSAIYDDNNKILDMFDSQDIVFKSGNDETTFIYNENPTKPYEFSTVEEFYTLVSKQLNSSYPDNGGIVGVANNGGISIFAKESMDISFEVGNNTNSAFLNMLTPLNGTLQVNSTSKSFGFQRMEKQIPGTIVDPDGNRKNVIMTMVLNDFRNDYGGNSWDISAEISDEVELDQTIDMKNVLNGEDRVDLIEGEDLWVKAGLADTSYIGNQYGYLLNLSPDFEDGETGKISFNLDGTDYSMTVDDGASKRDVASAITSKLQDAGYIIENDGDDNIVILPKNNSLVIKDGYSSVKGISIPDAALVHMTYGENNDFTTSDEFLTKVNNSIGDISFELSIENGKLKVSNNNNNPSFFALLEGENSNTSFLTAMNAASGMLDENSTNSSNTINAVKIYDYTSSLYQFQENGEQVDPKNVVLNNGGEELTINLESIISTVAETPIVDGFSHNGVMGGNFAGYSVSEDGSINISFSNGQNASVGKVNLFHFQNDQGLEKIGDNLFAQTGNSGDPFFYINSEGNYFEESSIFDQTLESSNVDTAIALTELIVYQRSFGGAAKAITTSDQMIQNAINMKK